MSARDREVQTEVTRIVSKHPGAQALVIIGTLSAVHGFQRHEVAGAFAYLSNMGRIEVDGDLCVWPAEVSE